MAIQVTAVVELPNDILLIKGTNGTYRVRTGTQDDGVTPIFEDLPVEIEARGWISATTNHFDADAYGDDGHRVSGANPRAMTEQERAEYALRLLGEQNP